jgi:hypothetical protein
MTNESEALLSDLVDGLDVDPDGLAAALRERDAADTLVAFARIRHQLTTDDERPSQSLYTTIRQALEAPPPRKAVRQLLPWFAVAALVAMAVIGGALLGRITSPVQDPSETPVAYCTDRSGAAHKPGTMVLVDGLTQECVARGDWFPVVR